VSSGGSFQSGTNLLRSVPNRAFVFENSKSLELHSHWVGVAFVAQMIAAQALMRALG
jgi:hypothetical protein